jgi:hypothetical protein
MPKWLNLNEDELWQQIVTMDSTCSYEDDPLSDWERDFGLRFFRKGVYKWLVQDVASGTIGSGELLDEAIADLRSKMRTREG